MLLSLILQIDWSNLQYTVDDLGRTVYSFPVHIRVLLAVALIFLLIVFILLGVVLSSRIYKTARVIKKEELQIKYQKIFRELLFEERQEVSDIKNYFDATDLKEQFNRETIMYEIIHLHENFTGETAERLEEIFTSLNFHVDAIQKLKDKRWYVIAKGLRELALMNVKQSLTIVSGFINNKNEILRMEARIAIMKLSDKEPLSFLSMEATYLSAWDTANIYSMLTKMPEKLIPDFSIWLDSKNKSVVLFCIQLIGTYRQQESIHKLLALLKSNDENIRFASIKALRSMNAVAAEKPMSDIYEGESIFIRLEILKTLESIGSSNSVLFLEKIIRQPLEDYPLTIQAVRALRSIGENGKAIIEQIFKQSGEQMQLVINHAKDKRL